MRIGKKLKTCPTPLTKELHGQQPNSKRKTVLEKIKTFFGRVRGQHSNKETIIVESCAWRCLICGQIFLDEAIAKEHKEKHL